MANALYDHARASFLNQTPSINMGSDDIVCALVSNSYTVDLVNHQYLSSISSAYVVATSPQLSGISTTNGVFNATNVTFTSVSSTKPTAYYLVIYKTTGSSSTSPLIAFVDTATGLPVVPNNSDITVAWSTSSTKIFSL